MRTLGQSGAWGVWVIIGLSIAFAALSLVNTAAMATAERRGELATIRLLGGTRLAGDPDGRARARPDRRRRAGRRRRRRGDLGDGRPRGRPRHRADACPATLVAGLAAGAALLGLAAGAVTARKAIRVTPAAAMRVQE